MLTLHVSASWEYSDTTITSKDKTYFNYWRKWANSNCDDTSYKIKRKVDNVIKSGCNVQTLWHHGHQLPCNFTRFDNSTLTRAKLSWQSKGCIARSHTLSQEFCILKYVNKCLWKVNGVAHDSSYWLMTKTHENGLVIYEKIVWRKILDVVNVNGLWRHYNELDKEVDIINYMKISA